MPTPSSLLLSFGLSSEEAALAFIIGQWPFFSLYRITKKAMMTAIQ